MKSTTLCSTGEEIASAAAATIGIVIELALIRLSWISLLDRKCRKSTQFARLGPVVHEKPPVEKIQELSTLGEAFNLARPLMTDEKDTTNQGAMLLHHNKFLVIQTPTGDAAFAGAGNLTTTAFTDNFENFYWIKIPEIVAAMKAQHEHLWSLATPEENLPNKDVLP